MRLRGYGIYSYRISDPRTFFTQISGTRDTFYASQLDGQLHNTIVARMTDIFANSDVAYLDMAAKQATLGAKIAEEMKPTFSALGLELTQFVVESISMPDDLQEIIDQRIGVGMAGDIGRYTQFEAAQALELAAANTGGTAGMGVGIGAGAAMAQAMMTPIKPIAAPASVGAVRYCMECGKAIPEGAKFCPGAAERNELSILRSPVASGGGQRLTCNASTARTSTLQTRMMKVFVSPKTHLRSPVPFVVILSGTQPLPECAFSHAGSVGACSSPWRLSSISLSS